MATIRRVLECGHVQRMHRPKWKSLPPSERETMLCGRCDEVRRVAGFVPFKPNREDSDGPEMDEKKA